MIEFGSITADQAKLMENNLKQAFAIMNGESGLSYSYTGDYY